MIMHAGCALLRVLLISMHAVHCVVLAQLPCASGCRSYGVLGTTSKLLAVGSNITSAITGTSTGALGGAGGGERMSSVSQGIMEGGKTFGEGLLKGVTGIVADPLAGAKSGGMLGLMKGVGKGLVGVPGQIIGGALSGISKVTEGLDASVKEVRHLTDGSSCNCKTYQSTLRGGVDAAGVASEA
jgi:hypothetical protein